MLLIEHRRGDRTSANLTFAHRYGETLLTDAFEFCAKLGFGNDRRIGERFERRPGEVAIDIFGAEPR